MPDPIRRPGPVGPLALVLALVALAGCGGSSKPGPATAAGATAGAGGGRFAAVRQCLAQAGINLPPRTPGPGRAPGAGGGGVFGGGGAGAPGGGPRLPAGVTRAQFQAALAKCGGGLGRGGRRAALTPAQKAAQQAALVRFAACMRTNGIDLPAPNTSGTGPVFKTGSLNTTSSAFTAARTKCTPLLPAGFGRRPGAPPAAGAGNTG